MITVDELRNIAKNQQVRNELLYNSFSNNRKEKYEREYQNIITSIEANAIMTARDSKFEYCVHKFWLHDLIIPIIDCKINNKCSNGERFIDFIGKNIYGNLKRVFDFCELNKLNPKLVASSRNNCIEYIAIHISWY